MLNRRRQVTQFWWMKGIVVIDGYFTQCIWPLPRASCIPKCCCSRWPKAQVMAITSITSQARATAYTVQCQLPNNLQSGFCSCNELLCWCLLVISPACREKKLSKLKQLIDQDCPIHMCLPEFYWRTVTQLGCLNKLFSQRRPLTCIWVAGVVHGLLSFSWWPRMIASRWRR